LFACDSLTVVKRENGNLYLIEHDPQKSYSFDPDPRSYDVYKNLKHIKNPHPDLFLEECKLIVASKKRDYFSKLQTGLQKNRLLCDKISYPLIRNICNKWIDNIKTGRINE